MLRLFEFEEGVLDERCRCTFRFGVSSLQCHVAPTDRIGVTGAEHLRTRMRYSDSACDRGVGGDENLELENARSWRLSITAERVVG